MNLAIAKWFQKKEMKNQSQVPTPDHISTLNYHTMVDARAGLVITFTTTILNKRWFTPLPTPTVDDMETRKGRAPDEKYFCQIPNCNIHEEVIALSYWKTKNNNFFYQLFNKYHNLMIDP